MERWSYKLMSGTMTLLREQLTCCLLACQPIVNNANNMLLLSNANALLFSLYFILGKRRCNPPSFHHGKHSTALNLCITNYESIYEL